MMIYEMLFRVNGDVLVVDYANLRKEYDDEMIFARYKSYQPPLLTDCVAFLRTCHMVHDEATEILYGHNTFHVPSCNGLAGKKAFDAIGDRNRGLLRHIKLEVNFDQFLYKTPQTNSQLLEYFTNEAMALLGVPEIHQSSLVLLQEQAYELYEHLSSFHTCKNPALKTIKIYVTVDHNPDARLMALKGFLLAFKDQLAVNCPSFSSQSPYVSGNHGRFFYQFFVRNYPRLLPRPLGNLAIDGESGDGQVSVTFRKSYKKMSVLQDRVKEETG